MDPSEDLLISFSSTTLLNLASLNQKTTFGKQAKFEGTKSPHLLAQAMKSRPTRTLHRISRPTNLSLDPKQWLKPVEHFLGPWTRSYRLRGALEATDTFLSSREVHEKTLSNSITNYISINFFLI